MKVVMKKDGYELQFSSPEEVEHYQYWITREIKRLAYLYPQF